MFPLARQEDLSIEEIGDELLIYDKARQRAHALNPTAAVVWRLCNGQRSVSDLAGLVERELGVPADEQTVWTALDHLTQAELLQERTPSEGALVGRRAALRKIAIAGGAAALVTSVAVPPPSAHAQYTPGCCQCYNQDEELIACKNGVAGPAACQAYCATLSPHVVTGVLVPGPCGAVCGP